MTQINITKDNVVEFLQVAVDKRGENYIDPRAEDLGCQYAAEDRCGCLIGTAFYIKGVSIAELKEMDRGGSIVDLMYIRSNFRLGEDDTEWDYLPDSVEIDDVAAEVLATAQAFQDSGASWGTALAVAKAKLKDLTA